ncbi:MAG: glycosyltransferase family 4 protein [Actinomycetota bacterium]
MTLVAHSTDRAELQGHFPPESLVFAGSRRFGAALRRLATALFGQRSGPISILTIPDYLLFDLHAFLKVRKLIRQRSVDYLLRVNPVSLSLPSLLPRLKVPVFTGPHNGGMEWPPGFAFLDRTEKTGQRFRFFGKLLHALYADLGRYAGIMVAHEACAETVPATRRNRVVIFSENGVSGLGPLSPNAGDATQLLYVGRLTPFKAVDIAIRALVRLPDTVNLTIVGDGPAKAGLQELARREGVEQRCRFAGFQQHDALDAFYSDAGVFVFPSVRESGGAVVLEAMSYGLHLPCLVASWGGPHLYTARTGVHLSVASPKALEDDLVDKIELCLRDPGWAREIGRRSRQVIADHYLWESKVSRLHSLLVEMLDPNWSASGPQDEQVRYPPNDLA